ncbi:unnamed protein product [Rangifer tarandus platyrhynchus]|uniref:Uncharacterized protein n=1 Tax=Rangifer tarandus platyrhynchus TaxID=3082113 RepID=A0ABN8Y2N5_RANTA|nr:unnamed protein product [Rangifer tarandus platyrhynchus]CAI9155728.1 unnamed protein product [Rangifer tarandus platyrhynchus]
MNGSGQGGRRQGAGLERPRPGGRRDLRAPHPNPKPRHAHPTGRSGSRNTLDPRAGPGFLARVAGVRGRGGFGRAVAGAPRGKLWPAGSTRHIRAKRRRSAGFSKAPGDSRLHLRSYHLE